ncbi:MAG: ABC transporter permease, partial [Verrucomicrobiota bacterium]
MASQNFSLFLGLRYLKPKRTFVSVITLISVFGVILGVALLIIVTSVMSGFERDMKTVILGFQPHLVVRGESSLDYWPEICHELEQLPNVEEAIPFVMGDVVVDFNNLRLAPKIHAIAPKPGGTFEAKLKATTQTTEPGSQGRGEFDLEGDKAILGAGVASQLGCQVGDIITILSPKSLNDMLGVVEPAANLAKAIDEKYQADPKADLSSDLADLNDMIDSINSYLLPREVEVAGIFDSGHYEFNNDFIFVPLELGQELYDLGPTVHGINVQTDDPYLAHQTKLDIISISEPFPSYNYDPLPQPENLGPTAPGGAEAPLPIPPFDPDDVEMAE